jgi:putative membrane protein
MFTDEERIFLDKRIDEAEKKTGAQIVLAVINRCDSYTEIPWKAFALGISVAGFVVFIINLFVLKWITDSIILISVATILSTGMLFVFLSITFPSFARLFLARHRKETEARQYAESLFLERELFSTKDRSGILMLISKFEKKVVLLADKGVRDRLTTEIMSTIISGMKQPLRKNNIVDAMDTGLLKLTKALCPPLSTDRDKNELSNEIIEEEGE